MNNRTKLWLALTMVGITGGLVGIVLTELLHFVQHHAYGYALDGGHQSFREGVEAAAPLRRFYALLSCGVAAGGGWWLLKRYGKPLVGIKASLAKPLAGLPFAATVGHALLQIVTVGLGSPLGREVAPREMTAAFASLWVRRLGLDEDGARLLIACASGAGLAALFCSVLATAVSRMGLGDMQQYSVGLQIDRPLLWWSAAAGPLLGAVAVLFRRTAAPFPLLARGDRRIVPLAVAAFAAIGLLAMYSPDILGNGKAGNQLVFGGLIGWQDSLQLAVLKWLAVLLALAAGAYGGLITPSMMLGGTLSFASAALWNAFFPAMPSESAAVVGAAAFLGVSLKMPLTAVVFVLELTRAPVALLMPLCLCLTGAVAAAGRLEKAIK
ncbi:chloride channel protein [Neisseria oralis]|uniref:chloride channel protein n=1 Tax=Neisseria oralis TaxID=1107316 RepID=UPI0027E1281E|nr:chloride channel protein [Neisseria oralis]